MKKARIYNPTKTAMQSGKANTKKWLLEYIPTDSKFIEPVMGWTGSNDTMASEVKMYFATSEEAENYAKAKGLDYEIILPKKSTLKIQSYSDNFKN